MNEKRVILVIEDERTISNFICRALNANDYKSIPAFSGKEGLSLFFSHSPDLVLLDLGLPDMDGMEILQELSGLPQETPVIIISARDRESEKVKALDMGADDYIVKPFGVSEMLARVRTMGEGDWAALPDSGAAEGLPRRLVRAGREARSMEEFYALAKTRRYTHARLRRLALWAFLGVRREDVPPSPPYLRVLGFNRRGQGLLREMRERARLPILTKPAHARRLDWSGRRLFELEARCTDLYDLCRKTIPAPGREWVTGPVRLEENQIQATGAEHEVYPEL